MRARGVVLLLLSGCGPWLLSAGGPLLLSASGLLLLSGCGSCSSAPSSGTGVSSQQPAPTDASPPADASSPSATSTSSSASSSSSTAAPAPSLTGFAALLAKYPEEPPWTAGPGTVCGSATCKKDELCCLAGERSRCMPKGSAKECQKTSGEVASCDESGDCSTSDRCCQGITEEGAITACASKQRCEEFWGRPGGLMLIAKEICARGGACKTEGTVCVAAPSTSVSGGQCVSAKARVACGAKKDCPADKPWCFWDADAKVGECIPRGPWLREEGVLECDAHSDCPQGMCCAGDTMTFCSAGECDPGLAYAAIVCRTARDCGRNEGSIASCGPDPHLPGGLGTCGWQSPSPR